MENKFDIIVFNDEDISLEVNFDKENDTVWLSQKQMTDLFDVSTDNIGLHIKNIFSSGELDMATTEEYSVVQQEGNRKVKRRIKFYNLDMITSVGYRVNSKKGILFRK